MANIDKTGTTPTLGVIPGQDRTARYILKNVVDLTAAAIVQAYV